MLIPPEKMRRQTQTATDTNATVNVNVNVNAHHPDTGRVVESTGATKQQQSQSRPVAFRSTSSRDIDNRPSTAPSQPQNSAASPLDVPRIAIYADALSFQALLKSRVAIRKSPTLDDLSTIDAAKRPRPRRLSSASSSGKQRLSNSPPTPTEPLPEPKLPVSRRPPASWSSHGIETSFGPPPALITRGSYSSDLALKVQNPAAATLAQQKHKPYNLKTPSKETLRIDDASVADTNSCDQSFDGSVSPLSPKSTPQNHMPSFSAMMDRNSSRTSGNTYLDDGASRYTDRGLSPGLGGISGGDTEGSGRSTEDLFLNLAQDSPGPSREDDNQSMLGRRLSRGRRSNQRASMPVGSETSSRPRRDSSSHDSGYATRSVVNTNDAPIKDQRRSSNVSSATFAGIGSRNPASISTEQRFNAYRNRYMTSTTPTTPSHGSRRPSAPESLQGFARPAMYRPSKLNNSSLRDFDSASNAGSSLDPRHTSFRSESHADGGESVVSTTAQSTVWDELQELKGRIHKMELADKLPSSGGTMSNGSGERPRTATTTVTTVSSSPKYPFKSGLSPTESVIGGPAAANIHPLLHQSLTRCKTLLNPALYRPLETAAGDALEMAVMAGSGAPQSSAYSSASVANGLALDRQLRRKADNVCRNLTDLCIALCEGKLDLPAAPSQSVDAEKRKSRELPALSQGNRDSMTRTFSRAASLEPESLDHPRPSPSRALDRVEARRASLMSTGISSGNNSPREPPEPSQRDNALSVANVASTPSPQVIAKLPRTGTSLLRTRRRAAPEEDEDLTLRAPSRAATEAGGLRKRSHRLAGFASSKAPDREYTSQHPLPNSSPLAPSSALRRIHGTSLKADSPRSPTTPTNPSSLQRIASRKAAEGERSAESDATATNDEEGTGSRRLQRRSLGLYNSARSSIGLGKRERRSLVATTGAE